MRKILTALLLLSLPSCTMMSGTTQPGYLVFFTHQSIAIDPPAANVIAQAAAAAKAAPGTPVVVKGYTDSVRQSLDRRGALATPGPSRLRRAGRRRRGPDPHHAPRPRPNRRRPRRGEPPGRDRHRRLRNSRGQSPLTFLDGPRDHTG